MKIKTWLTLFLLLAIPMLCEGASVYTLNEQWVDCGDGVKLLDPYYSPGVIFKWEGPSKNGKAHGNGTATKFTNGKYESTYVGEYKNGIREGKGTFTHKDGSIKTGTFVGGQLTGKGTWEADNGDIYEGEFINYRAHGNGKIKWGNGATFEGFFVSDNPYTGKYTGYDGTVLYLQGGEPVASINEKKSNYSPKIGSKVTEYFDADWNRTDAKHAKYYRIITYEAPHKPKGVVKDYYMNGKLQGETSYAYVDYDDEEKNFKEGKITTYYPNGKIASEGYYLNNKPNGPYKTFYENGQERLETAFNFGEPIGEVITYYENGIPDTVVILEDGKMKNNKYLQFTEDGEGCFLVYNEDFERNSKQWEYRGANGEIVINDNNTVTFDVTPGRSLSGAIYTDFSPKSNNVIEVSTRQDNLSQNVIIGLLFGFKDWDNYCGFLISGKQFTFVQVRNGKMVSDYDWEYCDFISPEINNLSVINVEDQLGFKINGQELGSIRRPRYAGDLCVLTVVNKGYQEVTVDAGDLEVWEIVTDPEAIVDYLPSGKGEGRPDGWKGSGSGFFITENGLLATNHHVVDGMEEIEVTFIRNGQQESYPASIVLSDKQNDLSILKIDSPSFSELPPIPYNFSTQTIDTGTEVFTLGYPFVIVMGDEVKFTDGKISSKTGIQNDPTVYQISVPIQPGNSGGPLFDHAGNLVGITSSGLNREYYKSENVNYAIKSQYLISLVEALPQHVELQQNADISSLPLTEKIKVLQPYTILIRVK